MFSFSRLTALTLLLLGSAIASALPPPVEVQVTVLSSSPTDAEMIEEAVQILADENWIARIPSGAAPAGLTQCLDSASGPEPCIARLLAEAAAQHQVVLVADRDGAEEERHIRCIGPDPARARHETLSPAALKNPRMEVSRPHRVRLSGCIIGALHGPRAAS